MKLEDLTVNIPEIKQNEKPVKLPKPTEKLKKSKYGVGLPPTNMSGDGSEGGDGGGGGE